MILDAINVLIDFVGELLTSSEDGIPDPVLRPVSDLFDGGDSIGPNSSNVATVNGGD